MLQLLNEFPESILDAPSTELHKYLQGPTLIELPGKSGKTLSLSCLIHGNEYSGLLAIQELIRKYKDMGFPRPVDIFIGNVEAAAQGKRQLDEGKDYNRIWSAGDSLEQGIASQILEHAKQRNLFASVDLHNNSGRNPCYSVVANKDTSSLNLASLFSDIVMYNPVFRATRTQAFAEICPSITIEASTPGNKEGLERIMSLIESLLHMDELPSKPVNELNFTSVTTLGTVFIPESASVAVGQSSSKTDFVFDNDFDLINFTSVPVNTKIGYYHSEARLIAKDKDGNDLSDAFFEYKNGEIYTKEEIMPAMITLEPSILKSDCVCYLMKEIQLS
mgnify:CR=1 FL=1|jgi:hypothetical protein